MSFKAKFHLNDTDNIDATMTITMPLAEWRELRKKTDTKPFGHAHRELMSSIRDMITQAEQEYSAENETE